MEKFDSCKKVNASHVGQYIRLEGRGIIDGLRGKPTKHDLWKVEKISHLGLTLKAFNAKSTAFLPEHQFRQAVEIYTKDEQVKLPKAF